MTINLPVVEERADIQLDVEERAGIQLLVEERAGIQPVSFGFV